MKIVISPAKSLDFETETPTQQFSECKFLKQAEKLNGVLKKKSHKQLSKLMSISEKLGMLNWERNQNWSLPFNLDNARQAVYAFNGDVYLGLDAYTIPLEKLDFLQDHLRILSGQYGILKPLDLIQPYRLEMGTKLKIGRKDNLYQFWGETISDELNSEFDENDFLVNLASNEYFKVIKPKNINAKIVTPVFKDFHNGKLKMIGFFAKKARGLMVRYLLDHNITTIEGIKNFDYDGYKFDENLSDEKTFVFTR